MAEDPIHRANRIADIYFEEGGLRDFIENMRMAYFRRYTTAKDDRERLALGLADKCLEEQAAYFSSIINAGKIEAAAQDHAERIARLSPARRRFL
jgi:hypothetical protein